MHNLNSTVTLDCNLPYFIILYISDRIAVRKITLEIRSLPVITNKYFFYLNLWFLIYMSANVRMLIFASKP